MNIDVQSAMTTYLTTRDIDGWISSHDRHDNRVEVCLFYPNVA